MLGPSYEHRTRPLREHFRRRFDRLIDVRKRVSRRRAVDHRIERQRGIREYRCGRQHLVNGRLIWKQHECFDPPGGDAHLLSSSGT
jgi:hypothetical protein